jgi:hypothetical protein
MNPAPTTPNTETLIDSSFAPALRTADRIAGRGDAKFPFLTGGRS